MRSLARSESHGTHGIGETERCDGIGDTPEIEIARSEARQPLEIRDREIGGVQGREPSREER